jgi:hypothetical protein
MFLDGLTQRHGSAGVVLYLDLDGFKQVNDQLEHSAVMIACVPSRARFSRPFASRIPKRGSYESMRLMRWSASHESDAASVV